MYRYQGSHIALHCNAKFTFCSLQYVALKDGDSVKEFSTKKRSIRFQRANSQRDFRTIVGKKDAEILRLNDEVTRLKQQIEVHIHVISICYARSYIIFICIFYFYCIHINYIQYVASASSHIKPVTYMHYNVTIVCLPWA